MTTPTTRQGRRFRLWRAAIAALVTFLLITQPLTLVAILAAHALQALLTSLVPKASHAKTPHPAHRLAA